MSERIHSRIAGTGSALPRRIVSNDELAQRVDTSDEWIATRTGIRQRHVAGEGETTGTLATDEPFYMENSWFVGYAPVEKPEIIVSVLLGNPESWHLRGHEAARMMIDRAMQREPDRDAVADGRPRKRRR